MLQFFNFINSEKTIRKSDPDTYRDENLKSEINHITRKQFKRFSVITFFFIIIG